MFETKERVDEALKSHFGFEKFKGKLSSQVFLAWKAVPVLRKRRQMIMARIVRRWRKSHITRGIGRWRTFTVAHA